MNYRGLSDTLEAISHLEKVEWPSERLEIVVVENASGDDSLEALTRLGDRITLVPAQANLGFAGGCNLGVRSSSGEVVAFLNNDARPDPEWISAAMEVFAQSPKIGAVASKVLDWEGERVDFVGAGLTWYGMGYKPFTSDVFDSSMPVPSDVLFGTGSAMFIRRDVFDELGGFDERYFMFFEDVDLGWRLNLRGWRFAYAPSSVAFHKHHGSMGGFGEFREQYLLERNALYTLYKNLGEESLTTALPAAMALAVRRSLARGHVDSTSLDLRRAQDESDTTEVPRSALTASFAIDQFVEHLPGLSEDRASIQASRRISDSSLWRLFGLTDVPAFLDPHYIEGYSKVTEAFDVIDAPVNTKVLIVTGDPIGRKIAGPAIRAWNIAEVLSGFTDVTLASIAGVERMHAPFELLHVRPGDDRAFNKLEEKADVIIFQGHAMNIFASLRTTKKIVIVDVYDPMHFEQLEQARELPRETWKRQVADATEILNDQLSRGDFFLCASDRQKHLYLGQLAALGRINPDNYEGDPHLNGLIAVAPFGMSSVPPEHLRPVLKGVAPGIAPDDKLLIWSGGLYNWFDPKTLIKATARLAERHDDVRLYFQGTAHPHPGVPEMAVVRESRRLAEELGVLGVSVFFNDSWVDYDDRQNYLTEADAGVSTHFSHVETTFSFRTRILDYLWAGLPTVVTEGDHFAELIDKNELGVVVPAEDVEALSSALEKILFDEEFIRRARANIQRVRADYFWDAALEPLVSFVRDPHPAADRSRQSDAEGRPRRSRVAHSARPAGMGRDLGLALHYLRNGGPRLVLAKARTRLRRA